MITERLNSILKAATALLGLALFALLFLYFVREATKVSKWANSGCVQNTAVRQTEDSLIVFQRIDADDFAEAPYPQAGDTVLEIADSTATMALYQSYESAPHAVGITIPITYLRAGVEQRSLLLMREPDSEQLFLTIIMQWLRFLIGFGFMGVGLWAFFTRPDSAAVRVFALFCTSMTSFMIVGVTVLGDNHAAFDIPLWGVIQSALTFGGLLMGGFWLNLQMLFPRPNKLMQKHPVWAYVLSYFFPVLGTIMSMPFVNMNIPYVQTVISVGIIGTILAGFVLLTIRFLRTKEKLERRQTRLVLWGSGLGLLSLLVLILVAQLFGDWFIGNPIRPLLLVTIAFLFLLLTPLSFAYAFGRYRLLEVQGKIRRGTRYLLLLIAVAVVYALAAVLIGDFLITQFGITSNIPMLLIAVALAMGITPTQKKIRSILEKKFYPERRRLREMLEGFLEGPECLCDRETFWSALEGRIRTGLSVNKVYPVLAGTNGSQYRVMEKDFTPFQHDSHLVRRLSNERRTLLVDEMVASDRVQLSDDETNWLNENRIALVMPLMAQQRLVGFLGIGSKSDDEDYTSEELRILNAFAPQVALASENIRLVEENVDKRRLEEQMAIARTIQQGFLPRTLPETPGLEVAAGSRFSLEVAGDYYDVITVDDVQTVLAVGDVSGKGAGAALLMANLQASLRTAIGVGVKLSDAVARINDLIHRNTPPEQYITFFVGVFNAATSEFRYVNAGHNSPIVIRANGETELLETGGLILGCLPGMAYNEGVVKLNSGDLIFMFTDGVSEAMNDENEEYGEDRIRDFIVAHRTLPSSEILSQLEESVNHFCGREPNEDDSTVLIARKV